MIQKMMRGYIGDKRVKLAVQAVFVWIGTCGVSYFFDLIQENLFSNSIFSILTFGVIWVLFDRTLEDLRQLSGKKRRNRRLLYAGMLTYLFSLCIIAGEKLKIDGLLDPGFRGKGLLLFQSLCLSAALFPFWNFLFSVMEKVENRSRIAEKRPWKNGILFLCVWGGLFLAWVPVFLAYYPAVMSYDFHRQSQEAMRGFLWFNDYQPMAHTWLIWLFLRVGECLGSYQAGMACFTLFQMLIFAASSAYACVMLYRMSGKKWCALAFALFYGICPLISVHVVCTTKDIMFTALFQVFVCLLLERTFFRQGRQRMLFDVLWVLEGIVMMLFRNNALYAVAVFMVFFIFCVEKGQKLRVFLMAILLVAGGKFALEGLHVVLGTDGRGSPMEMFNVPVQQFARVGYYQRGGLDEETWGILNRYVPEEYWDSYNPSLGDAVRWPIESSDVGKAWTDDYGQLFRDWLTIGLRYPNDYIDAFLVLTSGYWFLDDVSWAEVYGYGLEEKTGAISTYMSSTSEVLPDGIPHESKFPVLENLLEKVVSANDFYGWPMFSKLFHPAMWCWALLVTAVLCVYMKKRRALMVAWLPILYQATMFLGPVVQLRYVLPVIVAVPLMLGAWMYDRGE